MALAAIARASRPHTPNAYKLLLPRDPRASAIILHRSPIIRRKAGERLQLTSVPRLGKLFPHAADGKERTLRLKRMIQRERRVIQDHFPHLRSRTFVRGRQEKLQPGSTPKKWVPIADRIPFFNLRAGDSVRVTAGHEKIMWASKKEVIEAAKADAKKWVEDTRDKIEMARKRIEKDGRVVTQENEGAWERELTEVKETAQRKLRAAEAMVASGPENKLYPRIFKIKRIDKAKAQVYLDGLHYDELPDVPDERQPNQIRRVHIPIHYSKLQLRIPDSAIEAFRDELRAAGVEFSEDKLPKDIFAVRMETRHVRAPDKRAKRFRWESKEIRSRQESSTSLVGQRRSEGRVQRAERLLAELDASEQGIEVVREEVEKRVVVRRLGSDSFEPVVVDAREEYESIQVDQTIDKSTKTILGSVPVPKATTYQPKMYSWDRVVLATYPPMNVPTIVRRVRVGETADEIRYEEVEQKPKITLLATEPGAKMLGFQKSDRKLGTSAETVAAVSWYPPPVEELCDAVAGGSSLSNVFPEMPDRYLDSRKARADFSDSPDPALSDSLPVERLLHKELANPYGKDKLEKARIARVRKMADEQADFVADTVGAHLVREARVQQGIEPRVGRKMSIDEVILTARRRWAELVTARRAEARIAFEERQREKWGPSKAEKKAVRKARKKSVLADQLRQTTLLPGKNQVIPVGLQRFETDAPR